MASIHMLNTIILLMLVGDELVGNEKSLEDDFVGGKVTIIYLRFCQQQNLQHGNNLVYHNVQRKSCTIARG